MYHYRIGGAGHGSHLLCQHPESETKPRELELRHNV